MEFTQQHFIALLPLLIVSTTIVVVMLALAWRRNHEQSFILSAVGVALALLSIPVAQQSGGLEFTSQLRLDGFAYLYSALILVATLACVTLAHAYLGESSSGKGYPGNREELYLLMLLSAAGGLVLVSAQHLASLFIGLELLSLPVYALVAYAFFNKRSLEAGIKYLVLSAAGSAFLLFGMALLYAESGSLLFSEIGTSLASQGSSPLVQAGIGMMLVGLAFKLSLVPFHLWTPDVYEGAPTPVTAFFAAAPKMAAMALIIRVVSEAFAPVTHDWQQVVIFIALASMILGAFAAIGQRNIKRLMAYSSISHMGYALVGLAAGTVIGVKGVMIYMAIYLAMTLGIFAFILAMRTKDGNVENIDDLAGLSRTNPVLATIMTIFLFSLAGIPPLAGFFGKWYTFLAAVQAGLLPLAIIGIVASVVGAFYYLRMIKIMWFDEPTGGFVPVAGELRLVLGVTGAFVLFYVFIAGPIGGFAEAAAKTFF